MSTNRRRGVLFSLGLLAVVVAVVLVMAGNPAAARRPGLPGGPPGPLCGWSTLWDCTLPDGSHQLVGGTQCDIAQFMQQTGATCVPATF